MTQYTFPGIEQVNIAQLTSEIQSSSITVALDFMNYEDTTLDVYFKATLSGAEETVLDTLVSEHEPEAYTYKQESVLMYQINTETNLPEPVKFSSSEGRNRVLASTKPVVPGRVLYFYWAGAGDDVSGEYVIPGGGDLISLSIAAEESTKAMDIKFGNYEHGELVYLAGGCFSWKDAPMGASLSCYVMSAATPTQQSVNLNFNVDEFNRLYATAPGAGTHGLAGTPVFIPNYLRKGYWDLSTEWTPIFRADQGGLFDWFTVEKEVARFVNRLPIFDSSPDGIQMPSPETSILPLGCFVRLIITNASEGTAWKLVGSLMTYREVLGESVDNT